MAERDIPYVRIQTPDDLGYLVRTHRKNKQLTLETFSELSHLSMQFLSDFEQGKKTGEIGKILKALQTLGLEIVVQPCGANQATRIKIHFPRKLRQRHPAVYRRNRVAHY